MSFLRCIDMTPLLKTGELISVGLFLGSKFCYIPLPASGSVSPEALSHILMSAVLGVLFPHIKFKLISLSPPPPKEVGLTT